MSEEPKPGPPGTTPYMSMAQYDESKSYYEHAYLFLYRDWEKAKKLRTLMQLKGEPEEKLVHLFSMTCYMEQAMKNIREALDLLAMERELAGFPPKGKDE